VNRIFLDRVSRLKKAYVEFYSDAVGGCMCTWILDDMSGHQQCKLLA
jgi:hypothetical protein